MSDIEGRSGEPVRVTLQLLADMHQGGNRRAAGHLGIAVANSPGFLLAGPRRG
jgi:hypothetical protein